MICCCFSAETLESEAKSVLLEIKYPAIKKQVSKDISITF